jgi:KDO2-lipid IV(A) lauroyltransferase
MWLFRLMPRGLANAVGGALGWLVGAVLRLRRRVVNENLVIAFGAEKSRRERDRIARACYAHFGRVASDALRGCGRPLESFDPLVEDFDNVALVRETAARHGGVFVVMAAHLGYWELLGLQIARRGGVRLCPIGKPMHNPWLDRLVGTGRSYENYKVLSTRASLREMVQLTRDGWAPAFLNDQDAGRDGVFVDFFGRPASAFPGAASFSVKLRLPALAFFAERTSSGKYRFSCEGLLTPPEGLNTAEAIHWLTQEYTRRLEERIRRIPEQYWWFHRRWKSRPRAPRAAGTNDSPRDDGAPAPANGAEG